MIYITTIAVDADRRNMVKKEKATALSLLRYAIAENYPQHYETQLEELLTYGDHGKPRVKDDSFYFNLSHSGGVVVCAIGDCEVGVDVEKKRKFSNKLKRRICTDNELALVETSKRPDDAATKLWTMKESYMKFTGRGFAQGIKRTEFLSLSQNPTLKAGGAYFESTDIGEAFLTVCSSEPFEHDVVYLHADCLPELAVKSRAE